MFIDDIRFLDGAGNVLRGDNSVAFAGPAGFGGADYSNLIGVTGEIQIPLNGPDSSGSSNSWGQAISEYTLKNDNGTFDPAWLTPGCVITIFYESANPPEIILQSWSGGAGWAKVNPFTVNDSGNIAQFSYDDMVASYGSEDFSDMDKFNIGDTDAALTVLSATVGTGNPDAPYGTSAMTELVLAMDGSGKSKDWGQASTIDTPAFDIAWMVPGVVITVLYISDNPPEIIFQSWDGGEGWAKVAPATDDGSKATFTYDDIVASYGPDFSLLNRVNVGDTGADLEVLQVTITVAAAETVLTMDGSGKSKDWGQASTIDTPAFDIAWLTPGVEITVLYISDNEPELILQSWDGGEGWAKVAPATNDGSKATFVYEDMVASYGDDFSLLNRINIGDTGADLEVLSVTINR
jgi:hypothetical protein